MKNSSKWKINKIVPINPLKIRKLFKLFVSIFVIVSLTGCYTRVQNIHSINELKDNNKILAGRFVFNNNDEITNDYGPLMVYFHKDGDSEVRILQIDEEGYVHIAVPVGQYNISNIAVTAAGRFDFVLNPFPAIQVKAADTVVNFGTIEVQFHQSAASIVSSFIFGIGRGHLRINHICDYNVTRPKIISKIAGFSGKSADRSVIFIKRDASDARFH